MAADHPSGLRRVLPRPAREAGVELRVAHVEGDNVVSSLDDRQDTGQTLQSLDSGAPLPDLGSAADRGQRLPRWLRHRRAARRRRHRRLRAGHRRFADRRPGRAVARLVPHGLKHLAAAVVAGHIIEGGPQAVGGNFSGFSEAPGMVARPNRASITGRRCWRWTRCRTKRCSTTAPASPSPSPRHRNRAAGPADASRPRANPAVETRRVPVGHLAHARCGDKGGNSNAGCGSTTRRLQQRPPQHHRAGKHRPRR